jgi:ion channel-forming bestrophin family protein
MIAYNTKDWLRGLRQFHRNDTIRKLGPALVVMALYTLGLNFLEITYLKLSDDSKVKNVSLMHSLLGFAISMVLVFRTNTAYDRWWEGRKLWGDLVNKSRNLAVKLQVMLPPEATEHRQYLSGILQLFPKQLTAHLVKKTTMLELDRQAAILALDHSKHLPTQTILGLQTRIQLLYQQKLIDGFQLMAILTDVNAFLDICGASERIKNTPIPFVYSSFIKKFILMYVVTLPIGYVFNLGYIAVPVVVLVFYVLASLELIAEEIEDPFGTDANDLPLEELATKIAANVAEVLH